MQMAMGECRASDSYRRIQGSSLELCAYKLAATCRRPTFTEVTWVNSRNGFAIAL